MFRHAKPRQPAKCTPAKTYNLREFMSRTEYAAATSAAPRHRPSPLAPGRAADATRPGRKVKTRCADHSGKNAYLQTYSLLPAPLLISGFSRKTMFNKEV
jgi:hypothetical protein